jgi:hypothetical protein
MTMELRKPSKLLKRCEWLLITRSNHYVSTFKFTNRFNISNAAVTCTATTTTVSVTATNGVGALTFLITGTTSATAASNFGPITTRISSGRLPNLLPGNYTFRVTDANGCFYSELYSCSSNTYSHCG